MSELNFQDLDNMSPGEEEIFYHRLFLELRKEDDSAARANLAAGVPVYYQHEDFKEPDQMVKEYPSGRMELIRMDEYGNEHLIKAITT